MEKRAQKMWGKLARAREMITTYNFPKKSACLFFFEPDFSSTCLPPCR